MMGRAFRTPAVATAALFVLTAALLVPTAALAADPAAPVDPAASAASAAAAEDDLPPGRPLPRNDRSGRFSAFAGASLVVPAGDLGAGVALGQVTSTGFGAEVGVAMGLTYYSGLELRGQYVNLSSATGCTEPTSTDPKSTEESEPKDTSCNTQMFAVGLGLTYHAAQGLGLDPWVRFGFGYRALTLKGLAADVVGPGPGEGTFHGIDVTTFALGGDYFPAPWFGIGLFMEGAVGIQAAAPSAEAKGAVYGLFQVGLRIALEPQRKAVTSTATRPSPAAGTAVGQAEGPAKTPGRAPSGVAKYSDFDPSLYNRAAQ